MAVPPKEEEAPAEAAEEVSEGPSYAEPMFQKRERRPQPQELPPAEEEYEDEYEAESFEEEEDDFVPPKRAKDADREEVYIPKGGYDTLKIEPVQVPEEEPEEEEYYEQPKRRARRPRAEEAAPERPARRPASERAAKVDVYALDEDGNERDDYYDEYEEENEKPRNKGLFIFCVILNIILILILLWFLAGLLVNLGILPDIDIGYSWFNETIYPLF